MEQRRKAASDAVITSARPSRSVDRNRRMRNYLIAMSLRVICFVLMVIIPVLSVRIGLAAAAAFLPGFAVMTANFVDKRRQPPVVVEPGYPESRPMLDDHRTVPGDE